MAQKGTKKVDYSKGIIYKLCCKDPTITDIYIGSTTNLRRRKQYHKGSCNCKTDKDYNYPVYKFIRDNGGFENWSFIEIEKYTATDKLDLEKRERHYIELLKSSLNTKIPTRTQKEYIEQNKEKIKEYHKQYREKNKDKILQKKKEHWHQNKDIINEKRKLKIICECGSECRKNDLQRHKRTKKHQDYINQQQDN